MFTLAVILIIVTSQQTMMTLVLLKLAISNRIVSTNEYVAVNASFKHIKLTPVNFSVILTLIA